MPWRHNLPGEPSSERRLALGFFVAAVIGLAYAVYASPDVGLEVAAIVGVIGIAIALMGRPVLTHPRCRRCRADIRRAGDACPGCRASLAMPRAVRWRPYPIRRTMLVLSLVVVALGVGGRLYGAALQRRGLEWRDLGPVAPVMRRIRASGGRDLVAWLDLERRLWAGALSAEAVGTALDLVEQSRRGGGTDAPFTGRFLDRIATHDPDPEVRQRAAELLMPWPTAMLATAGARPAGPQRSLRIDVTTRKASGPSFLLHQVRSASMDGSRLELRGVEDEFPVAAGPIDAERLLSRGGSASATIAVDLLDVHPAPGRHTLRLDVEEAVVDSDLGTLIRARAGDRPGPPERWTNRAPRIVRTVIMEILVLEDGSVVEFGAAP